MNNTVTLNRILMMITLSASCLLVRSTQADDTSHTSSPPQQKTSESVSDIGNMYPIIQHYADRHPACLSYLAQDWPDTDAWRTRGRDKLKKLLSYDPKPVPLNAEILSTVKKQGYTRYLVRYNLTDDRQTEAFLLIPDGLTKPAPAIVALHDHGGFYYFGKEKITETENPPTILKEFIDWIYEGRCFADELARRGFVVLAPDAFYFGSQRLKIESLPEKYRQKHDFDKLEKGSDIYIRACNSLSRRHETIVAKTMFAAGTTWPGLFVQGDRIAVNYLLTRPEVDPERIGCMGLSGGGFRSTYLFGMDSRIKVGVIAGFMPSYKKLLFDKLGGHTWMVYVPRQYDYLDIPDVATLNAPRPLMVINCLRDNLFTMESMKSAEHTLRTVYQKMHHPENFKCNYYDTEHSLKLAAQNDAIAWLEKWLK